VLEPLNPLWPLGGGLLIGLSAAGYLLMNGRIAGISGLAAGAMGLTRGSSRRLGLGFIAGLLAGAALAMAFVRRPEVEITTSLPLLIVGGLLVGFGTRWGSGCTSGHGVCGLARLSPRSLIATGLFMGVAALTVFVTRHLMGGVG
jgi:uncharacterized membrane protein YedE/YeeE